MSPALSVVLASSRPGQVPESFLSALKTSCGTIEIELLLTGSLVGPADGAPPQWELRSVPTATGLLVPDQWGAGLREATAPLVAFFTPDMQVKPGWWRALSQAMTEPLVAGASGGIALAEKTGDRPDAGVFLARYSAFLPQTNGHAADRADLPGEATLYRRDLLTAFPTLVCEGFWEVRFHDRLRAEGWKLRFLPDPIAEFTGRPGIVAFTQQRCRHAMDHGSSRVRNEGESPWRVLARAPAVPAVLVVRSVWRCMRNRWGRRALAKGVAPLLLYSVAWAIGEVFGAFQARASR